MDKIKSSQEAVAPVVKSVRVSIPIEEAFNLFTEKIHLWWPLASHSVGGEDAQACILEGKVGGRFYEVQRGGAESDWGKVLDWDPPNKVAFAMHPGRTPDFATEVEVSFSSEESGCTLVTLVHRGWERLGEIALTERNNYDSGWDFVLGKYSAYAQ